uniref:Uncharacterized protein n=1 Tax=Oryctolagus cuniculus TaxID=9986 RepID=G1SZL2_RABIT
AHPRVTTKSTGIGHLQSRPRVWRRSRCSCAASSVGEACPPWCAGLARTRQSQPGRKPTCPPPAWRRHLANLGCFPRRQRETYGTAARREAEGPGGGRLAEQLAEGQSRRLPERTSRTASLPGDREACGCRCLPARRPEGHGAWETGTAPPPRVGSCQRINGKSKPWEPFVAEEFAHQFHESVLQSTQKALQKHKAALCTEQNHKVDTSVHYNIPELQPPARAALPQHNGQQEPPTARKGPPAQETDGDSEEDDDGDEDDDEDDAAPRRKWQGIEAIFEAYQEHVEEQDLERQVLQTQCRRLEAQHYSLSLTAEQLSHSMAVSAGPACGEPCARQRNSRVPAPARAWVPRGRGWGWRVLHLLGTCEGGGRRAPPALPLWGGPALTRGSPPPPPQELRTQKQKMASERERLQAELDHLRKCLALPALHWPRGYFKGFPR